MDLTRLRPVAGVVAPAAFVGAWVTGGLLRDDGYSPVSDAISRLAETGQPTAPLMTAGFVAYGVLAPVAATALRDRATRAAVVVTGLGTLAVAAFPLSAEGGQPVDAWHAAAALVAYTANVAAPSLAGRRASPRVRRASYALSAVIAACLVGSIALDDATGLLQRTGLTLFDAWLVATCVRLLRER